MGIIKIKKLEEENAKEKRQETSIQAPATVNHVKGKSLKEKGEMDTKAVLYEDESRANENSRHYVLNNGTAKTVLSAEAVNFYNEEENKWQTIDNTLIEKESSFESSLGNFKTEISKMQKGKGIRLTKKDRAISWEYIGKEGEPFLATNEESALKVAKPAGKRNSKAVYENVERNTDLEYCLHGNGLKENIIVKERSQDYRYRFALKTDGLKLRLSEDNQSLEVYSGEGEEGKVEFTIPSPYMYDTAGKASEEVYYELEPAGEGEYNFIVVANEDWVNAGDRQFPVTIDPQIVTNSTSLVRKWTYYRERYVDSSSGVSYGLWTQTSMPNIKVGKNNSLEYKTELTVKRSLINVSLDDVASVKLILTPQTTFSGYLYCNNELKYYNTANGNLTIDITNKFKNNTADFIVSLTPNSSGDMQFSMQETPPTLEIEYLTDENVLPTRKSYSLAGAATGEVNFLTGEVITLFNDVEGANSLMGLPIFHVYKKHNETLHVGDNFRLNLHEKFFRNGATYEYTDAKGDKHGFKEYYYYLNEEGKKHYVLVGKHLITVGLDGRLKYGDHEVFTEYKSTAGLQAITRVQNIPDGREAFENEEYFENREQDEKQLQEQFESYKTALENFVMVGYGNVVVSLGKNLGSHDAFEECLKLISQCYYLMTKAESEQYEMLEKQEAQATDSEGKAIYAKQQYFLREKTDKYLPEVKKYYKEYVNLKAQLDNYQLQTPINFLTDGKIIKGYNKYGQLVQIYDKHGNRVAIQYERYDGENLEEMRILRVYNEQGKSVLFDYNPKGQLSCITDVRGRNVHYVYDEDGKLAEVKYDTGKHFVFEYDTATDNIHTVTEKKTQLRSMLGIYTVKDMVNRLTIYNSSVAKTVKNGKVETDESAGRYISMYCIDFTRSTGNNIDSVLVEYKKQREKYDFDLNRNLIGYYLEENGLVTKAEQYEYQSYWNGTSKKEDPRSVTVQAKKDSLYKNRLENYTFVAGDSEKTTLDQFNNAVCTQTSAVQIAENNTVSTFVEYTYDDNQKLIQTKTTLTYSNPVKEVISYKKYNYNAYGDIIRTESYVEGEEYTLRKTIEETVCDEKGNVIKSFTYSTLDSSSKFYTQTEYDETGKVSAKVDATGENKTKFGYLDGTNVVREELLPNGSKFAYGHDYDDSVTAITQSTGEGEENSTQRVYTCGKLTELTSGNNIVQYSYDYTNGYQNRTESICYNGVEDYLVKEYREGLDDTCCCWYDEVQTINANNESVTVRFDKRGNMLFKKYGEGTQTLYEYDDKDRLTKAVESNEQGWRTLKYQYDNNLDYLIKYVDELNGTQVNIENYTYNSYGQIATLSQSAGADYTYNYSEDSTRRLEEISVLGLTIQPVYDKIKRNKGKQILVSGTKIAEESIVYRKVGDHATNMCASMYFGCVKNGRYTRNEHLKYAYDNMGNITSISENGNLVARYGYDKLNRLVREDNKRFEKTWLYTYDNNGNILCKRETDFTLEACAEKGEFVSHTYEYDGDKLLSYNEESFEYDPIGNPTTYRGKQAEWKKGRRLTQYNGHTFVYDEQGRRVQKDGITFTYDSQSRLIQQSNGLIFFYDHTGVAGFTYNNATYLYRKDAQKNVVAILNTDGTVLVRYAYDAWGNYTCNDLSGEGLGELNPFRYRSYYYDTEIELYFLKTRYYDPEIGRFMTIDGVGYLNFAVVNGLNLYAYCGNNPVMAIDPHGNAWWNPFSWDWETIGSTVANVYDNTIGKVVSTVKTVITNVKTDISNYDINNTDPQKVIDAHYFSAYIGEFALKSSLLDTSGFSFGIMVIGNNVKSHNLIKHEYGHYLQLQDKGFWTFTFEVALPSITAYWVNEAGKLPYDYLSLSWEHEASSLGGDSDISGIGTTYSPSILDLLKMLF